MPHLRDQITIGTTCDKCRDKQMKATIAKSALKDPSHDFGEPWETNGKSLCSREGPLYSDMITEEMAERVVSCVNACAGMRDPVADLAKLRKAANEFIVTAERIIFWPNGETSIPASWHTSHNEALKALKTALNSETQTAD